MGEPVDVYKRQAILSLVSATAPTAEPARFHADSFSGVACPSGPVSYTHLDVYKRQVIIYLPIFKYRYPVNQNISC